MQVNGVDLYWNPYLETMPREMLRNLQLKKFKRILKWGYENSGLYRRLYDQAGLTPEDIKTWDDVAGVPMLEKEHYRSAQAKEPWPYGDSLCVPLEEVTAYRQTSGTTGQPVYQPDTWQDWEWWSECWAYTLWAQGFRNTDRVFIPFGYNIFVAYWAGHYAAEKIGCEVIPGGILNTEERILKMKELRASAFMATPTYVLGMAETAEKLGIDPRTLGIKRILCAGEPGASIPPTKRRMEEAWGTDVYDHIGATEIGGWAYECTAKPGGPHVNEAMFLVELIDLEDGSPIEEPGKPGRVVITAFDRRAQPCIRFDSKDVAMWGEPCACGRSFRVLKGGVIGRVDHITKIKGVLFSPSAVEEVVRDIPELGNEFELVVRKKNDLDELILKVEILPHCCHQENKIKEALLRNLRLKTNLNYYLEFHPYGTLPRYEVKSRRFKDLRK
ncbi:phenylacetate--CoA ligase family protein [Desulfotomaculum copahuensis]|uniref:Phenylacetate--CoA ligase n=1 Tax=Desulfotomaculum copahuensis TaxID=1838280 RepID=A0A1B7LGQ0_9FIRM|nr:AMP-binding protein [Desulfotomaculum copahuensis]OAT85264.1 phenylacetate--CoA ligase [Desulfotomaculum copahuensis]